MLGRHAAPVPGLIYYAKNDFSCNLTNPSRNNLSDMLPWWGSILGDRFLLCEEAVGSQGSPATSFLLCEENSASEIRRATKERHHIYAPPCVTYLTLLCVTILTRVVSWMWHYMLSRIWHRLLSRSWHYPVSRKWHHLLSLYWHYALSRSWHYVLSRIWHSFVANGFGAWVSMWHDYTRNKRESESDDTEQAALNLKREGIDPARI